MSASLDYIFEVEKFREETSGVQRRLLNFAKRTSDCELARADLKVGVKDLYEGTARLAETKLLESAFGGNRNKSAAAVLGKINGAAHQMSATLQHCPDSTLSGDSFDYLKERCKELANRIDEMFQALSFNAVQR